MIFVLSSTSTICIFLLSDYMTESVFTLSQLSAKIASVFRQAFATSRFWVTAEIIGLKLSRGHCYLQLAEKDTLNIIKTKH